MDEVRLHPDELSGLNGAGELRSVAQLKMLHSLAAKLNRLNDVRQIGEAITGELRTLIDYNNCRVHVLDAEAGTLFPIALRGELAYEGETFEALIMSVTQGITGWVARNARSYYSPNAMVDEIATTIPGTDDVDESILAVPMLYGDRVIGTIALAKLGVDQFDEGDRRMLEVLASHAAVAIENARLLESERASAAKARESEARKSAILESAIDCIIAIDHTGRITEFNPAAEKTFGYSREEAIGHEMAELIIPPDLREQHRQGLARYLATGEAAVLGRLVELRAVRADGSEFPVELAIAKVDLPGPPLFTGYIRDITDRKQAQAEIERALQTEREASQSLRTLDEMKNTFLQAVSHDLRTPLAAVLGLALTLNRDELGLSDLEQKDLTRRLAANARKLDRILTNLLDLERLIRGVVEPSREDTDLRALVERVIAEVDFLGERPVTVEGGSIDAYVDAPKVERIVENLLVNAVRHTPEGTPIRICVSRHGSEVLILVEDAGPGVPEEYRVAIFEPFRQGPHEQHSPGSGIGLSLVARFAQLHGGRAWVEEREGGGASFKVLLPDGRGGQAERSA
jgi:PAS domain S-box-containing protein